MLALTGLLKVKFFFFFLKVCSSILIMLTAYQITLSKYAVAPVINAAAGVGPFWH